MRIDVEKCVGCGLCVRFCPMNSIALNDGKAHIDEDGCVDCSVCLKSARCPRNAIFMPAECFESPRAVRVQFSDPNVKHPGQETGGRGTEEAKTNDVTGKFRRGEFGLMLEFGRPCVGVRFSEMEKITMALKDMEIEILPENPVFDLLKKDGSGRFREEYRSEKVLSAILELRIEGEEKLLKALDGLLSLLDTLDTLVSVGLVARFDEGGAVPGVLGKLRAKNIAIRPNAKINVGLGRPLIT